MNIDYLVGFVFGVLTGIQICTTLFFLYLIRRVRMYEEQRMAAVHEALAKQNPDSANPFLQMMQRFQGAQGLKKMEEQVKAIVEDPKAHELKMLCDDCKEEWFPNSSEEMAPCPKCGSGSVTGSA